MPVEHFDFDWRALGAEIERHPHFPNRTNVSFVKLVDEHTIDVRFWERGAGETMSSGTGSTGAAAMAVARGMVTSPVRVLTPAGPIDIRFEGDIYLTGPAEIIAEGEFFLWGGPPGPRPTPSSAFFETEPLRRAGRGRPARTRGSALLISCHTFRNIFLLYIQYSTNQ